MALATLEVSLPIARRLYLPEDWAEDKERRDNVVRGRQEKTPLPFCSNARAASAIRGLRHSPVRLTTAAYGLLVAGKSLSPSARTGRWELHTRKLAAEFEPRGSPRAR